MEYKKFQLKHVDQVIELLNLCFPKKHITSTSFLWKHFDPYFKNKSIGMVAIDNKQICAFVCFTPLIIANHTNIYRNFYSCAIQVTHPDYRRKGIISDLTQIIEKRLKAQTDYIGFSNDAGVKIDKFSKRIGYKIIGKIHTKHVLSLPYKSDFTITPIAKIITNINWKSNYFGILKNSDYLNWRYFKSPKNRYEYFEIKNHNRIVGYIVCKNRKIKYDVYELLLKNKTTVEYKSIIKAFANFAFSKGKPIVSYAYLQNDFLMKIFPFISVSKKVPIYFTIKTSKINLTDNTDWIIHGGDIQ